MGQIRTAGLAACVCLYALALSGCGAGDIPMAAPVPVGANGPDPAVAESPVEADAVMTCATIDTERAGIAQGLERLGSSNGADELRKRDAALAQLAASKRCAAAPL